MAEKDYVGATVKIGYSGVLPLNDAYKMMLGWFKVNKYSNSEPEHRVNRTTNGERIYIKWIARKKVSDYVRCVIVTEINVENAVEVESKKVKKKLVDCELRLAVNGFLEKDYEGEWTKNPVLKFMRESYDRFVIGSRMAAAEKELNDDIKMYVNEIKAFLKVQKMA